MVMVFTLVDAAQQWLTENTTGREDTEVNGQSDQVSIVPKIYRL